MIASKLDLVKQLSKLKKYGFYEHETFDCINTWYQLPIVDSNVYPIKDQKSINLILENWHAAIYLFIKSNITTKLNVDLEMKRVMIGYKKDTNLFFISYNIGGLT